MTATTDAIEQMLARMNDRAFRCTNCGQNDQLMLGYVIVEWSLAVANIDGSVHYGEYNDTDSFGSVYAFYCEGCGHKWEVPKDQLKVEFDDEVGHRRQEMDREAGRIAPYCSDCCNATDGYPQRSGDTCTPRATVWGLRTDGIWYPICDACQSTWWEGAEDEAPVNGWASITDSPEPRHDKVFY